MSHALNFHDFRIAETLIHDAIIAYVNSVGALGATEFHRPVRQWIFAELLQFSDNARYWFTRNPAILSRRFSPVQIKRGHRLELGNELLVRNGGLLPALWYDGQSSRSSSNFSYSAIGTTTAVRSPRSSVMYLTGSLTTGD